MNQTEQIAALIQFSSRGRSDEDIVRSILNEWRDGDSSYTIQDMLDAQEYYMVRNINIDDKNRNYFDEKGNMHTNQTLSNVKIRSGFLRRNVEQKINYALGKPLVVTVDGPRDNMEDEQGNPIIDTRKELYIEEWNNFLSSQNYEILRRILTDSVNKGIGWAHVYLDEGMLVIDHVDAEQVYPEWADKMHDTLDAVVRDYTVVVYEAAERTEQNKVEFWTPEAVKRYIYDESNDNLIPDTEAGYHEAHMQRPIGASGDDEAATNTESISWGIVPFVDFKGNPDELPMLNILRAQIDAYDAIQSKSIDALLDDVDPILVIEKVTHALHELQVMRQAAKNSRIMAVDDGGKVYYVQVNPNIDAIQKKLEILKKDMREFGYSVDYQDARFGTNPSGVAMKAIYQDIDTYTNGLQKQFSAGMDKIKRFFDMSLEFRGAGTVEEWQEYNPNFEFNRDMMINLSADIQSTVTLAATNVSQETIDNFNPVVDSHEAEEKRRQRAALQARQDGDNAIFEAEVAAEVERRMQQAGVAQG